MTQSSPSPDTPRTAEDAFRRAYPIGNSGYERTAFMRGWQARGLATLCEAGLDVLRRIVAIHDDQTLTVGDWGHALDALIAEARAALANSATAPAADGIDVERLARALHEVYQAEDISGTCWHDHDAERVAREYARLREREGDDDE